MLSSNLKLINFKSQAGTQYRHTQLHSIVSLYLVINLSLSCSKFLQKIRSHQTSYTTIPKKSSELMHCKRVISGWHKSDTLDHGMAQILRFFCKNLQQIICCSARKYQQHLKRQSHYASVNNRIAIAYWCKWLSYNAVTLLYIYIYIYIYIYMRTYTHTHTQTHTNTLVQ